MQASELLYTLAAQKKLSHAYLFSGNNHQAKDELVQKLLRILGVQFSDYTKVSPAKETGAQEITISQIRSLSGFLSMSAWNSPYKVAVLDRAHCMNQEAQSAFLKLLEEPKGATLFFLLSDYADMLLPAIRSRAQEFPFYSFGAKKISPVEIQELQKLQKADIATRFSFAKKLSDTPEQISQTLDAWLMAARRMLHVSLKENLQHAPSPSTSVGVEGLVRTIRVIQETAFLLRTTNLNPRLALERIMLNL